MDRNNQQFPRTPINNPLHIFIPDDTENPTFHPMMPANINEGHNEYYPPPDPHHQFGMQPPMQMHRNNESWYTNPIDGSNMRLFYPPDDFQGAPVHQPMQGGAPFYQQMPGEPVYQHMPGEPFYQPLQGGEPFYQQMQGGESFYQQMPGEPVHQPMQGGEPFYQQMQGAPFYQQIPGEPVLQQIMPEAPVHQQTIRKTPDTNIHEGELQFFDFTGLDSEETARIQNILHNPDPAVQMPPENNENDESRGLRELYNSRRDETIRRNSTPVRPDTNPQEGDELQFLDLTGLDSEETARIQNILHNPDLSVQMPPENNENEYSSNISRPANSTSQLRQTPQARKQAKRKPMKKRR
ncbi:Hypothetical predicted protein [Cloeon dipterum]|uniref:Uncharacterized protein n=1 Tax=Cloeon dipterum TaxID=197152 RepID=A0A8S1CHW4_9INSE|nr:Hypothetical predicted protein [Cloeon dipterum]